ncbi:hypothetical protein C7212DRAFT_286962 [Tuber magnatum]|uniref:FUN14-domain-containing protein n=1 Tax=Tuber magnatum TaxID=42249 RepID=A0A317SF47_9PEZI|nr:hypothetical protein C7212DRAFT_286962 [Tuber magnatum]
MVSRFILPSATFLGLAACTLPSPSSLVCRIHCESHDWAFAGATSNRSSLAAKPRTTFSPLIYRQVASGSFIGLAVGLAVCRFSKSIALIFGSLLLLVEFLAMKGFHVVPYKRLSRWTKDIDLKDFVTRNMAFKVSFGAAFALSSYN